MCGVTFSLCLSPIPHCASTSFLSALSCVLPPSQCSFVHLLRHPPRRVNQGRLQQTTPPTPIRHQLRVRCWQVRNSKNPYHPLSFGPHTRSISFPSFSSIRITSLPQRLSSLAFSSWFISAFFVWCVLFLCFSYSHFSLSSPFTPDICSLVFSSFILIPIRYFFVSPIPFCSHNLVLILIPFPKRLLSLISTSYERFYLYSVFYRICISLS